MKSKNKKNYTYAMALAALGVVYGDIGTSPLYALKEAFHHSHNLPLTFTNILGILSLIFWSLISVVSIKYLIFVVRADNQGEGGVLALTTLLRSSITNSPFTLKVLTMMGVFGTALLYGDGMITPAISVLSAVEGLEYIAPKLSSYIIPITIGILVLLFSIQKHGTSVVGKVFGPVTFLWFFVLAILGIYRIWDAPEILYAVNPIYAYKFFMLNQFKAFVVLGSVFLVVTGGEALYSDLGHFGKKPIRLAWFTIVLPALVINYFGQGAMLLKVPSAIKNPFYMMAPNWALIPLVILATMATVIASQALITGVFSLTMQAVQLQYIPRVTISHTSHHERGQIYVKKVNFFLMVSCIVLVLIFGSSSNLAAAYGIAVTTTMVITTILFFFYVRSQWNWNIFYALGICVPFLIIETAFWGANLLKFFSGGYLPIIVGLVLFLVMTTWRKGRELLALRMSDLIMPLNKFLEEVKKDNPYRVPGFAVYMSGHPQYAPTTIVQSYKHFRTLHDHLIFLTVKTSNLPHIPPTNRIKLQNIGPQIYRIEIQYGYMDLPNVAEALHKSILLDKGIIFNCNEATFFLGREHILATERKGMAIWREKLFSYMSRNSQSATDFFHLPKYRVIEISSLVEL